MKRTIVLAGVFGALAFVPTAGAAAVPPINCGIVSCTYPVEKKVEAVQGCVDGAVVAIREIVQGTPQPQMCNLG